MFIVGYVGGILMTKKISFLLQLTKYKKICLMQPLKKKSTTPYILIRNTGSIELTDYTQVFINPLSHFSVPSPDHSLPLSSTGSVHR